jgi:hypothetical protein
VLPRADLPDPALPGKGDEESDGVTSTSTSGVVYGHLSTNYPRGRFFPARFYVILSDNDTVLT